jgi:hypothetical protein
MAKTTPGLAAIFALLCLASTAWPAEQRVAVLQPDEELVRAISLALAPWGLETIRSREPLPGPSHPEIRVATRLAQQLGVQALVWVTQADEGALLWVFDVGSGDVTTRLLTQTLPFDSAAAAAVALSVKTVLRASEIAPPAERFGSPSRLPAGTRTFALEGGGGANWVGQDEFDPRAKVAAAAWLAAEGRLGFSLELSAGPGMPVTAPAYTGRYQDVTLGGSARFALVLGPRFSTVVSLGGGAHWTSLRGTLAEGSLESRVSRVNGAIELSTSFNFYLRRGVYLGVSAGGAYFPRHRRYLVGDDPVFAPSPVTAGLAAYGGVELF